MESKGQIWVSAVLYIALGMIVITLILSAGVPLINKMRDRNTIAQTKSVMFDIDNNLKAVVNEAKGSTRYLSPVDINSGQLFIYGSEEPDPNKNKIVWSMKTNNKMMEPNIKFTEGDLNLKLVETAIEGEYEIQLYLDYFSGQKIDLSLGGAYGNPFQGRFSFSIKNKGEKTTCLPPGAIECPLEVEITVT